MQHAVYNEIHQSSLPDAHGKWILTAEQLIIQVWFACGQVNCEIIQLSIKWHYSSYIMYDVLHLYNNCTR